ncbi:MAG: amino acid permease [Syntrophobacteraceae bacterium]|nr:amino acid permease [Syntrophobacteraceae bacterium]
MKDGQCSIGKKPISLFSATILVIANMIGTGVFTTLGFQLAGVHLPFSAILLWVVGGIVSFCGALSYAELGAMMPRSGGEYAYLSKIYHPAIGFLSGSVSILVGFGAPIALAAMALGRYSQMAFHGVNGTAVAGGAIIVLTLVHLADVKWGCHFQNVFTVAKIVLIALFIAAGLWMPFPQRIALPHSLGGLGSVFNPDFAVGLVYVSFAYSGWNASAYIGGEILAPERNIPFSLFFGTLFVSILYVLLNLVFLLTVPAVALTGKIEVGSLSARAIFGAGGAGLMTSLICLVLISTLSSMIMVGPRVAAAMGEDIEALGFLARRNSRGVPARAILIQSSVAILIVMTSAFNFVLTYVGFTLTLFSCMAVLGVFVLRFRKPDLKRPFKTWGYPVVPALYLAVNIWMLCYLVIQRPLPSALCLMTVASLLVLYKWLTNRQCQFSSLQEEKR